MHTDTEGGHDTLLYLYGGNRPWDTSAWVATDDRVRGGSSISHLSGEPDRNSVRFHGCLDTSTLGGAGFASQRTRGELSLDLRQCDGIVLLLKGAGRGDGGDDGDDQGQGGGSGSDGGSGTGFTNRKPKRYLVTLKDDIPPPRDDGREQSGISWEAEFQEPAAKNFQDSLFIPWHAFKATYRGRDKPDAEPLDLGCVKRIGIMMRSFFDEQHGSFSLTIRAIAASRSHVASDVQMAGDVASVSDDYDLLKEEGDSSQNTTTTTTTTTIASKQESKKASTIWNKLFCGLL